MAVNQQAYSVAYGKTGSIATDCSSMHVNINDAAFTMASHSGSNGAAPVSGTTHHGLTK
jgi:hypothetical protein